MDNEIIEKCAKFMIDNWYKSKKYETPKYEDLLLDLKACAKNFKEFEIEIQDVKKIISFKYLTDNIKFYDVFLGQFRIIVVLDLSNNEDREIPNSSADYYYFPDFLDLKAIALTPNPPAHRDEVTHPHVESDCVCLGDGFNPFIKACFTGRISDALDIANSVINTYSPASPYVAIDEWEGQKCGNCDSYCEYEPDYCDICESDICDECCYSCDCGRNSCHRECLDKCSDCGNSVCSRCSSYCDDSLYRCENCVATCDECSTMLSKDDLNEKGLCSSCEEELNEEETNG